MVPPRASSCWFDSAVGSKMVEGTTEYRQPLESLRDKEADCPQRFQKEPALLRPHFWCHPCQMSDPWIVRRHICVVLSHCVYGHLLQQEINTQERGDSPGTHPYSWELAKDSDDRGGRDVSWTVSSGNWRASERGFQARLEGARREHPGFSILVVENLQCVRKGMGTSGEGRGWN